MQDRPVPHTQLQSSGEALAAGLRAFFRMAELWSLSNEQARVLLGRPSKATFHNWKKGAVKLSPSVDLAARLGYLLGIFRSLQLLYSTPENADRWVSQPNSAFGGQSALERMLAGQITDLAAVHDYLASVRSQC